MLLASCSLVVFSSGIFAAALSFLELKLLLHAAGGSGCSLYDVFLASRFLMLPPTLSLFEHEFLGVLGFWTDYFV